MINDIDHLPTKHEQIGARTEHEQFAPENEEWVYNYTNEHAARHGGWHIRVRDDNGDCLAHALNVKTAAAIVRGHRLAVLVPGLVNSLRSLLTAVVAIQDSSDARFSSETKKAIRDADVALSTVAKELRRC